MPFGSNGLSRLCPEELQELGPPRFLWRRPVNDPFTVTETTSGIPALRFEMELEWQGVLFVGARRHYFNVLSVCDKRSFEFEFRCTNPQKMDTLHSLRMSRFYPITPRLSVDLVILAFFEGRPLVVSAVQHYFCESAISPLTIFYAFSNTASRICCAIF